MCCAVFEARSRNRAMPSQLQSSVEAALRRVAKVSLWSCVFVCMFVCERERERVCVWMCVCSEYEACACILCKLRAVLTGSNRGADDLGFGVWGSGFIGLVPETLNPNP